MVRAGLRRASLSAAAGRDAPKPSAGEASGPADLAMDDLRRTAAMGWRNPALYRYEPALGPLRARDDFRELMRTWTSRPTRSPGPSEKGRAKEIKC